MPPGGLGVLEANANLNDAILMFAQAPESFSRDLGIATLLESYTMAGSEGPATVLERCMRIMRDPNESLGAKIVAIRILDLLMAENGAALAMAFVNQLRFFTSIAKRSKERERRKRRPTGMFAATVSDEEAAQFVLAVGELLDKWGRRFEEATSELREIARARGELLEDRVKLPAPEQYRFLGEDGPSSGGGGLGGGGGPDEALLRSLADEFQSTLERQGPEATETAEAHSRFEAELEQWRRAAQEAAERDDFAGYERYSEVAIRFAELGTRLEKSAANSAAGSAASTPATSPAPPIDRSARPAEEAVGGFNVGPEASTSSSRRRRHHSRARDHGAPAMDGFPSAPEVPGGCGGFPGGPEVPGGCGGFPGGPEAAGGFNTGPEAGGFPAFAQPPPPQPPEDAFGSFGGGFPAFGPGPPAQGGPPSGGLGQEPPGSFGPPAGGFPPLGGPPMGGPPMGGPQLGGQPMGGPPPAFEDISRRGSILSQEEPMPGAAYEMRGGSEGSSEREATLMRMNQQLISQVQALQAQVKNLNSQLEHRLESGSGAASEQLRSALRRVRELEPLQAELSDSRATARSLRELNDQLQGELAQGQRELRQARRRAEEAEAKLAEREDVITETRQRLFDAKQRSAELEDEMRNQSESQKHLHGRLQTARAEYEVTELELRQLRHAVTSAGGLPQQPEQPRGNQSYSRDLGMMAFRGSPPPSVNQCDELAGSATGGTPLQQLTRQNGGGRAGDLGPPEPAAPSGPRLPRSSPEVWQRTPKIGRPPGAIVSQSPSASRACLERVNANFQKLLVLPKGLLYEDQGIVMSFSIAVASSSGIGGRPVIDFEACVANSSGRALHDVQLRPSELGARSSCDLRIEAEPLRSAGLGAQQRRFRGRLEVFGVFETGPQVDLAYLLPDNLSLRVRLRLPLAISRFMSPGRLEAAQIVDLWSEPEFAHAEVAVVCTVRRGLLGAGAPFSVWKCLELGGVFRCFPGIDENSRGVVLASSYPQRQGQTSEVLVRAELGGPMPASTPGEAAACRVAVRSVSHEVNRALAQLFLDILCDAPESAAAA